MACKHKWETIEAHYLYWCLESGTLRYVEYMNPKVDLEFEQITRYKEKFKYNKPKLSNTIMIF